MAASTIKVTSSKATAGMCASMDNANFTRWTRKSLKNRNDDDGSGALYNNLLPIKKGYYIRSAHCNNQCIEMESTPSIVLTIGGVVA